MVMAGLLPCLQTGGILGSKGWVYLDPVVPGVHPIESLTLALSEKLHDKGLKTICEDLEDDPARGLHLYATALAKPQGTKVVLFVDQFEELFTLTTSEDERRQFVDLLINAITEPGGPVVLILTLRVDFSDRPMQYPELYRLIDAHHSSVLPMEIDDLRGTIEQPAALPDVQLTFEGDLVGDLLFEIRGQTGALPLLQFTLDQLFQRRSGHQLTLQSYREIGGVKGALSQHAEETYQALPSDEYRQMARDIFLRLIEPGTTEQDTTRRRAPRSEFERAGPMQTQQMQETLEAFIRARLLTTNQTSGKTTIEVSHEALIREWKRLAEWLRGARDDILFQQSLSEDVMEWEQRKRPRGWLYRGVQLKEALTWARRNRPSEQEAAFLRASAAQRIQSLVSLIIVVLLLLSSLGIAGWYVFFQPQPTLVTTQQDSGVGSLRWCIDNVSSGSTITFDQHVRGIIELTGGDLVASGGKRLTIAGPGANQLTISGGNINAHIHVTKGATLNISGLSFKNSETLIQAFLFNQGTLTVTDSTISDNKTTAGVTSFGGGIYNTSTGTLTVTDSTFSGNSASGKQAGQGGGIDNEGKLTMTASTLSYNSASGSNSFGGGILSLGKGSPAIIRFCTIYGNTSSAGGGIWLDPTGSSHMTTSSNIIAANSAHLGPDISGALISDGYNLLQNVAGVTGLSRTTDKQVALADLKIDPTLRNNGGLTQTLALQPGSPAIDAVPGNACSITVTDASDHTVTITTDERGDPRPDGSENKCDIGAYESSYSG